MKKICVMFLILSLVYNVYFVNKYVSYINMNKRNTENIIKIAESFESISEKLELIKNDRKIKKYDLSVLQEQVVIVCYELENFWFENKIKLSEKDDIYQKFMTLKDIVFKIDDVNNIEQFIIKSINNNGLCEYLEKLSSVSSNILSEKYGKNVKYNELGAFEGIKFYNELLNELIAA